MIEAHLNIKGYQPTASFDSAQSYVIPTHLGSLFMNIGEIRDKAFVIKATFLNIEGEE